MNNLELLFASLAVAIFVLGLFTNYSKAIIPESIVQLFRYGRANISNTVTNTYIRSIEVPKRWFYHFYFYAVVLQALVVITVWNADYSDNRTSQPTWLANTLKFAGIRPLTVGATTTFVATSLFLFHLSRRLFETLCVCIYSGTKMNVLHYLLGYVHYTGAIFCIVAHSSGFASDSAHNSDGVNLSKITITELCGVILFFIGNYLQHRAHVGLANLRKGKDKATQGHQIPRGELFEYISCPNYFAEIIIYCALASLFGFRNSSWNYCTAWVIANQIIAGIMNHLWYHEKFEDYPKQRKAIIPFIW